MAVVGRARENLSFRSWYMPGEGASCFEPAHEAFDKAKKIFSDSLRSDQQQQVFGHDSNSIEEFQAIVYQAKEAYERRRQKGKARQWLSSFSSRILYYGAVLDTLAQHHPEYVSLAWGTVKFLFIGVMNQEELIAILAKAMCRVADSLPRQQLATILYPTQEMKRAVAQLYAHLMEFFLMAWQWYQEGVMKHMLHSITQPASIRYKDILNDIEECSRRIDQWAVSSAQAEIRDMHTLQQNMQMDVQDITGLLQKNREAVSGIMEVVLAISPQISQLLEGQLDTNQRVSDLQLSQMLTYTANSLLADPETSYRFGVLIRNKHQRGLNRTPKFWLSPRLKDWTTSKSSSLIIVRGSYATRSQAKDFGINVIEAVRSASIPVLWALHDTSKGVCETISTTDLLKSLVRQAIRINKTFQSEKICTSSCTRMQSARDEKEWLDILGSVLVGLPLLYIVVNLESLGRNPLALTEHFSWPLAFISLFQSLSSRGVATVVKIVLITYGDARFLDLSDLENPEQNVVSISPLGWRTPRAHRMPLRGKFNLKGFPSYQQ